MAVNNESRMVEAYRHSVWKDLNLRVIDQRFR
jgi:hypothetical protein